MKRRAIVYIAWGEKYVREVYNSIKESKLPDYDVILITDMDTVVEYDSIEVVRADFELDGLVRKSELLNHMPERYDCYLLLDADTRVIGDIKLGFAQAELHGMALSPAPHYSLDWFWGFDRVMRSEGIELQGQLQYNTGVIFFSLTDRTRKVLTKWHELCRVYKSVFNNDQPYLTLAMEMCEFNPYALSIGYNYRGFGDAISGIVRIWHSYTQMPGDINEIDTVWPPRRVVDGKVHHMIDDGGEWYIVEPPWSR